MTESLDTEAHPVDARVRKKVERRLQNSPDGDAIAIKVEIMGRHVLLDGLVGSYSQRVAAAERAEGTLGVEAVENRIRVRPCGQYWATTDGQVVHAIDAELAHVATFIDLSMIRYSILCHVVQLEGELGDAAERGLVHHIVETVAGVDFVENHVEIRS